MMRGWDDKPSNSSDLAEIASLKAELAKPATTRIYRVIHAWKTPTPDAPSLLVRWAESESEVAICTAALLQRYGLSICDMELEIQAFDLELTQAGILALLNRIGGTPDPT